jgi:hypothetical protein
MTVISRADLLAYKRARVSFRVNEGGFTFLDLAVSYSISMGVMGVDFKTDEGTFGINIVFQECDFDEEMLSEKGDVLRELNTSLESCLGPAKLVLAENYADAYGSDGFEFFGNFFQNEKREYLEALFDASKGFEVLANQANVWVENFSDEDKNFEYKSLIMDIAETLRGLASVAYHFHALGYRQYKQRYGEDKTLETYCHEGAAVVF